MINYIWVFLILSGIIISCFTGNITSLGSVILNSTNDAFNIFMKLSFMILFWNGMFNILKDTGYLKKMSDKLSIILHFIFPEIGVNSKALEYISITILSNILGLGVASTATGLKAFELLQEENKNKSKPSRSMITFIVLNITSFTIFPTSVISLRNSFGGSSDFPLLLSIIITTLIGSIIGIILDKFIYWVNKK